MKKPLTKKPGPVPKLGGKRLNIRLSAAHVAKARQIGEGNVTLGIETALDQCKKRIIANE